MHNPATHLAYVGARLYRYRVTWWFIPSAVVLFASNAPQSQSPDKLARDVHALFQAKCVSCHGTEKRKGGLRLDQHASILAGGATGPAVAPGNSKESLLLQRARGEGDEDRMPPEGDPLSTQEIQLLKQWIDTGAAWPSDAPVATAAASTQEGHWAYRAPKRPPVPEVKSTGTNRVTNPIDAFIIAALQKKGLTLSPPAAAETRLRRASLDLIGLPPTPEEVDAFLRDKRPDAFARQVDRLLASPHFGERWARWWLDMARYADSHGYEKDRPRVMWKYRDWVIDAFNQNMSFKQFTLEQIAGDMLPGATLSQKIATGFHRNTLINQEGGVDPEEAYFETLVDRVGTTASVWLGATLACAQCHNHKFDPLSQKDFYKFMAFFANNETQLRGTLFDDLHMGEPIMLLPTPEQEKERSSLEQQAAALEAEIAADSPARQTAQGAWEQQQRAAEKVWQPLTIDKATSSGGAKLSLQKDGSALASGPNVPGDRYEISVHTSLKNITGIRLEVLGDKSLPHGGPGRSGDGGFLLTNFDVTTVGEQGTPVPVKFSAAKADEQVSMFGPGTLLWGDDDSHQGWTIDVKAEAPTSRRQAVFALKEPLTNAAETKFTIRMAFPPRALRSLGRFRLSVTSSEDPLFITQIQRRDRATLDIPPEKRTEAQKTTLANYHRTKSNFFTPQREKLEAVRKKINNLGIVTAMVLQERSTFERPSTFVRARGNFTAPTERVFADVPKALPPLPPNAPANRLGLARWLVDEANPLTARVTVNRFWEQLFGRGLVETSEDMGTQSAPPTHPELLDWLATEYMRLGWDTKAMLRTLVLSATYQQSSKVLPIHKEKDPNNHLLARAPRFRMEAETLRDSALAAAGLLSKKMGGPSVFPWQPAGVWQVPFDGPNATWKTSPGEDAYRRTMYTFLRRSSPYPLLTNFDATSRETCTLRRPRTNTPLQVLNTLNDPVFFEAAQGLAARMQKEGGRTPPQQMTYGFRLVTARAPAASEVRHLETLYKQQRSRLEKDPAATAQLLVNPTTDPPAAPAAVAATPQKLDQAALTLVANVLLSLDETLTKE